jgi:hypothetical protein
MATVSTFSDACLVMQGYVGIPEAAMRQLALAIRFTPAVCTGLIIAGLAMRSPAWLGGIAAIALIGGLFPSGHPIDLVYNHGVRHLVGGDKLPPNPPPRRFACFVALFVVGGAALAFATGHAMVAYALGGLMVAAGVTVTLTNWCLASWMYGLVVGKPGAAPVEMSSR